MSEVAKDLRGQPTEVKVTAMEDSDSGVTSMSSEHGGKASSMTGDDRSGAGSRSSAASLALSEVYSPAPSQLYAGPSGPLQQQQLPLALTVPRASSTVSVCLRPGKVVAIFPELQLILMRSPLVVKCRNLFVSGEILSCWKAVPLFDTSTRCSTTH